MRQRHHADGPRRCRAVELADSAAGATRVAHLDAAGVVEADRDAAERAPIDALTAGLAETATTVSVMDLGEADSDRLLRHERERAARAGLHARQVVAEHASALARDELRRSVTRRVARTQKLEGVHRACGDTTTAALAGGRKLDLRQRTRRPQRRPIEASPQSIERSARLREAALNGA